MGVPLSCTLVATSRPRAEALDSPGRAIGRRGQPSLFDRLVEGRQRTGDVAAGSEEVIGLLVAGATLDEGEGVVVSSRCRPGSLDGGKQRVLNGR